jgi:hypothetical protein
MSDWCKLSILLIVFSLYLHYNYSINVTFYRRSQINIVDVDSKELISAWGVFTTVSAPQVLRYQQKKLCFNHFPINSLFRTYDVSVSSRELLHKKIVFKNPWSVPRRFAVRIYYLTDHNAFHLIMCIFILFLYLVTFERWNLDATKV